jgi:hypothetical protein
MIEKEYDTLSSPINTMIEHSYTQANAISLLPQEKKKSWFSAMREKVSSLVSKQDEIKNCEHSIKNNTPLQESFVIIISLLSLFGLFPMLLIFAEWFKELFSFFGYGFLLNRDNHSVFSYVITSIWFFLSMASAGGMSLFVVAWVLPKLINSKIFTRKKEQLIVQKDSIIAQANLEYTQLQKLFSSDIVNDLLDYFSRHFPGINHEAGYNYHQCYHILKNCFETTPVDYKVAMVHMETLFNHVERFHPEEMNNEHKILMDKIKNIL